MLVFAIAAYRLEHGELPKTLADLNKEYFDHMPLDPYSGYQFRYFPRGIPADGTKEVANQLVPAIGQYYGGPDISSSQPGVWCINALLTVSTEEVEDFSTTEKVIPAKIVRTWQYNYLLDNGHEMQIPTRRVWQYGSWFPIPAAGTK